MPLKNQDGARRIRLLRCLLLILLASLLLTTSCHVPLAVIDRPTAIVRGLTEMVSRMTIRIFPEVLDVRPIPNQSARVLLSLRQLAFPMTSEWSPSPDGSAVPSSDPSPDASTDLSSDPSPDGSTVPSSDPSSDGSIEQTGSAAPALLEPPVSLPAPPTVPSSTIIVQAPPARVIDPAKPMVALTFDDGPRLRTTLPVLDVLKANHARATFFVLGAQVAENQLALVRMVAEGHEIGNHTFSHARLTRLSAAEQTDELERTQTAVVSVTGYRPKLIRPTFGAFSQTLQTNVQMPLILWSVDTLDWKDRSPSRIIPAVLNTVKDGDIVIMHDIYDSTVRSVEAIVPELIRRGFQLVTVSELVAARGITLAPGTVFSHARK